MVSAVWENRVRDQKLMLVLTGSAVSVMEQMLGAQGGLHRRAALELRLDPFAAREARAFLPDILAADFLTACAVCGGYPLYLDQWDQSSDVEMNLRQLAYESAGIAEIDVLGISADRTALLGECRWQTAPLTSRDVLELQRKVSFVPEPAADIRLLFWTRTGATEPGFPARAYSAADIVG